jgi:hypothetical protein
MAPSKELQQQPTYGRQFDRKSGQALTFGPILNH